MQSDSIVQSESTSSQKPLVRSRQGQKITVSNDRLQTVYRRLAFVTFIIPWIGTAIAVALLWQSQIGLLEVGLLLSMYALTTFGIEVGFHRYFSHRAFKANSAVRAILAILGSMAAQGGVIYWVAHHRRHHQYTDQPGDPHSPHLHGEGFMGQLRGFWHAHLSWTLEGEVTNSVLFAKDLIQDPLICKLNQLQHIWALLGLAIPAAIAGVVTGTWMGVLQGLLWGGFVRIVLTQQITASTNSICHLYGKQPFDSKDHSTNNVWLAIFSFGQSWHNNHHAFPNSAVAGLEWWQLDPGTWVIRLLEFLGLVWDVNVPTKGMMKSKKVAS